ncbi:MAG TPA: formate dehydrogenase subunit alpha [Anaerolineales bacterium]|nr:formate dehydrogenase subunit alpha [Anaerolineales bacterium]
MTLHLTINGKPLRTSPGRTVLEAAAENGITIPTLCYHKDLSPVGSCRLCNVEVAGWGRPAAACTLAAVDGMVVETETPALAEARRGVLELLLEHYDDSGYAAEDQHASEFMYWVDHYGAQRSPEIASQPRYPVDADPNPFVWVDLNKCILCTRCVRACEEIQGRFVWGVGERGAQAQIIAGADTTMLEARCESCGACAAYCPTGALEDRMSIGKGAADKIVTTTCPYCGVGCRFDLHVRDGRIIRAASNPAAPVNGMHLCVKGRYGYDFVHHPDRLTRPMVRDYLLEGREQGKGGERGAWVEVDWETALDLTAEKLASICEESGPDAVGVLSSAKCTNEENYLMQKFARQVIGTHNIDHCARLCHASTVAGLSMCYGSGAMTNTMGDILEEAAALFIIGSNTTEQHPVFGTRIRGAVRERGVKLVVADPRAIDITEFADLHLRHRPGTDVALVNGLMHVILREGLEDGDFIAWRTEGFETLAPVLANYPPDSVAEITGVPAAEIERAARMLAENKPMAVIFSMGITQHTTGVLNVLSLGNLQMLLGNIGIPGGGVNPLRGQNNVQGACDMGALVNVFPGYQRVTDEAAREKFARAWALEGANGETVSPLFGDEPGLAVTEQIPLAETGEVRALVIMGENPSMTDPDANHVRACLDAAEFIVLQEIFPSETSKHADVLLPGAAWAEKDGTFTNTERRVQAVRTAVPSPGEAQADWRIITELARRLLARRGRHPAGPQAGWEYASPEDILAEVRALTPSYAGITENRLARGDALHWPVPEPEHPGTPILHVGRFTRGLGKFHACDHLPARELPDAEYPYYLTSGRVLYHWHGGEMTRRSAGLNEIYPETLVEISPEDALKIGLNGKQKVRVRSRRGEVVARAVVTDRVAAGVVFGNFHFPGEQNVNNLTIAALDPIAKIPEYKGCAVRVEVV